MTDENNILASVEKLVKSQSKIQEYVLFLLKATGVLIVLIFFVGILASWMKISRPKYEPFVFNNSLYKDGSVKYKDAAGVMYLGESFFDEHLANFIKSGGTANLSSYAMYLNNLLGSKLIVFTPASALTNKPKTEEAFAFIEASYQKIKDSLSYVVRQRMYLDYSGTSLLERINNNESYLTAFKENITTLNFIYSGDFDNQSIPFSFQIGMVNSVSVVYPDKIHISCSNSAPVLSSDLLTKTGVPAAIINNSELEKQAGAFNQLIKNAESSARQQWSASRDAERSAVANERKAYREDFYVRWYSNLLLLINSIIFIFLLVRYGTIIGQRKLPRKSTDFVYYATNRTSRLFRIIALIGIGVSIVYIVVVFIGSLFSMNDLPSAASFVRAVGTGPFIRALLNPPATFVLTIISTWFLILTSEWVDFISNCYEITFYKAHEKKIGENKPKEE